MAVRQKFSVGDWVTGPSKSAPDIMISGFVERVDTTFGELLIIVTESDFKPLKGSKRVLVVKQARLMETHVSSSDVNDLIDLTLSLGLAGQGWFNDLTGGVKAQCTESSTEL